MAKSDVVVQGGKGALRWHHSSLAEMLREVYPDYPWRPSKFATISEQTRARRRKIGSMRDVENQRLVLSHIGRQLAVNEVRVSLNDLQRFMLLQLSDWYRISRQQVIDLGGRGLFHYYSSLPELLRTVYPQYPWEAEKFASSRSFSGQFEDQQRLLTSIEAKLGIKEVCVELSILSNPYISFYILSQGLRLVWD